MGRPSVPCLDCTAPDNDDGAANSCDMCVEGRVSSCWDCQGLQQGRWELRYIDQFSKSQGAEEYETAMYVALPRANEGEFDSTRPPRDGWVPTRSNKIPPSELSL